MEKEIKVLNDDEIDRLLLPEHDTARSRVWAFWGTPRFNRLEFYLTAIVVASVTAWLSQ